MAGFSKTQSKANSQKTKDFYSNDEMEQKGTISIIRHRRTHVKATLSFYNTCSGSVLALGSKTLIFVSFDIVAIKWPSGCQLKAET